MQVAVTGASGHIGACLVRRLVAVGHKVMAIARGAEHAESLKGLPVQCINANVCDASQMKSLLSAVDCVYHLAGLISITGPQGGAVQATNVEGVRNVAEAALSNRVRRMIHISSIHAYDFSACGQVLDEGSPKVSTNAKVAYDRSKAEGERVVQDYVAQGLNAVVLNPTGVIGPFDYGTSLMGKALLQMYQHKVLVAVDGGFNWIDVRDLVETLLVAASKGRSGECYLLGGHYCKIIDLLQIIAEIVHYRPVRCVVPIKVARMFAPIAMHFNQLFRRDALYTPEGVAALRSPLIIEDGKARVELAHHVRPLVDTLRDTYIWWVNRGKFSKRAV